jgi:hypothetical protein
VTHPHDNRISILGTDDVTTGIIIVVRHTGKNTIDKYSIDKQVQVSLKYKLDWMAMPSLHKILHKTLGLGKTR